MSKIEGKWKFPSNEHGETKGINDSGITLFKGTPLKSLAREICQNSLDAATEKTTIIEFNLFTISKDEIPGQPELLDAFERSLKFWENNKSKKTKTLLNEAVKTIDGGFYCNILRISDYNTTGLSGSKEMMNTDWTNLIKSSGASDKSGSAGGSYGIGKFAPFACSACSTVFYSTHDKNGVDAYQGVCRLVTFEREDKQTTQGIGYFGNPNKNLPIYKQLTLDERFNRNQDQYGTDIYILGFKFADQNDWQKEIIISILDSFLGALWNEKLEIIIDNKNINKANLASVIEQYKTELDSNTSEYYEVLCSEKTKWFKEEYKDQGEIELGFLIGQPNATRKISMIRKTGMKILEKDYKNNTNIPFTGIMLINGEKLNEKLRGMENPEHTDWQANRTETPKEAKEYLKNFYKYISSKIEELVNQTDIESVDAAGIGAYLPDDADNTNEETKEEVVSEKIQETTLKKITTRSRSNKQKGIFSNPFNQPVEPIETENSNMEEIEKYQIEPDGEEEAWIREDTEKEITNPSDRPPQETQKLPEPLPELKIPEPVSMSKIVVICTNKKEGIHILKIIPEENACNGGIKLYLSAESNRYDAPLLKASLNNQELKIKNNCIQNLTFIENEQITVEFVLDYNDYCSMEVEAYAIKQ